MRIGIDFDNTLAGYDAVFLSAARAHNLVPHDFEGGKTAVRNRIRLHPDGETAWMRLQGQVYGALMGQAILLPGAADFLSACRGAGYDLFIVSHKTQFGHYDDARVDLRAAALSWMRTQRFFDPDGFALNESHVFFEATRDAKVDRIRSLDLQVFIDDLPEVLSAEAFPETVERVLIGEATPETGAPFVGCPTWKEIQDHVFSLAA